MPKKIDILFIAKEAGVSAATVSRVINKTKPVSRELKTRVMQVVEKYNFRPNLTARSLIYRRSMLIGVLTPRVSNAFHAELISQIELELNRLGYDVIISNISGNFENEKRSFKMMCDRRVDGIILLHENTPEEMDEIQNSFDIPIVLASVRVKDSDLPTVSIDDEKAGFEAVRYLTQLGHRKIAGVFSNSYSAGELRKKGFIDCLTQNKLEAHSIVQTECSFAGGADFAKALIKSHDLPSAIFFVSDEMAIGAINVFRDHQIRIPEDISIFSFDDIELSKYVSPRLSTIHQPIAEIGKKSSEMLLNLIDKDILLQMQILLPHQVIIRDSCTNPH